MEISAAVEEEEEREGPLEMGWRQQENGEKGVKEGEREGLRVIKTTTTTTTTTTISSSNGGGGE